jgi:hypothetical protein
MKTVIATVCAALFTTAAAQGVTISLPSGVSIPSGVTLPSGFSISAQQTRTNAAQPTAQANQRYHARQNVGGGASAFSGLSGFSISVQQTRTNAAQPTAQGSA